MSAAHQIQTPFFVIPAEEPGTSPSLIQTLSANMFLLGPGSSRRSQY